MGHNKIYNNGGMRQWVHQKTTVEEASFELKTPGAYCLFGLQETVIVDALLVAAGRSPNVASLGLEAAGVQYNKTDGIKVSSSTFCNLDDNRCNPQKKPQKSISFTSWCPPFKQHISIKTSWHDTGTFCVIMSLRHACFEEVPVCSFECLSSMSVFRSAWCNECSQCVILPGKPLYLHVEVGLCSSSISAPVMAALHGVCVLLQTTSH